MADVDPALGQEILDVAQRQRVLHVEISVSGKLKDIVDEIERIRSSARQENGWIMDCLLLKKPREESDE